MADSSDLYEIVADDYWIFAYATPDGSEAKATCSIAMKETDPQWQQVLSFVNANGLKLVDEKIVLDSKMMYGKARVSLFANAATRNSLMGELGTESLIDHLRNNQSPP